MLRMCCTCCCLSCSTIVVFPAVPIQYSMCHVSLGVSSLPKEFFCQRSHKLADGRCIMCVCNLCPLAPTLLVKQVNTSKLLPLLDCSLELSKKLL